MAASASGHAAGFVGREAHIVDAAVLPRRGHRDLAGDELVADLGGHARRGRGWRAGRGRPRRARRPASSSAAVRSPSVSARPTSNRLPEGMVGELARTEAVLERGGPGLGVVGRERDETATEIAGRGDVEIAAQPPGAPAVVGDADDRGDLARVLADARVARRQARALRRMQRCSASRQASRSTSR